MTGQPGRSGGDRQGVQGKAYANRTDLMQKQRSPADVPAAPPTPAPGQGAPPVGPEVIPLGAPSQRPGEHVMSGAPMGPGPGPMEAGLLPPGGGDPVAEQLMAILSAFPNDDLRDLVESIKAGDYSTGGLFGPRIGA